MLLLLVPGCSGEGVAGWNYCYKPDPALFRPRVVPCSPSDPCLKCQAVRALLVIL